MNLKHKQDIELIPENEVYLADFIKRYSEWINKSGILLKESKKYKSSGKFCSDIWIFYHELSQSCHILKFYELYKMKDDGLLNDYEIDLFKCWLIETIMNEYECSSVYRRYSEMKKFILSTKNFDIDIIKSNKGNFIHTFLAKKESTYNHGIYFICEYISFLDDIGLACESHLLVLSEFNEYSLNNEISIRQLPSNKDVLAFNYYLNKFFYEIKDNNLLNYYKPLLLWWKITMVIPMRASEFAYKLKRDCLSIVNDRYYLLINRLKIKSNSRKSGLIPLLNKIELTKELYDLIDEYIKSTNFDKQSQTLISYESIKKFRNDYSLNSSYKNITLSKDISNKMFPEAFNRSNLNNLINCFYKNIIENYYNYTDTQRRLLPGDTRHFAFSNLILQGVSPVEIAMLGGHTTLRSQASYTGHIEYYIDSEILNFIGNRNIQTSIDNELIINIIFNKPQVCPKLVVDCIPTEDGIGFCTLDFENDNILCNDYECCIFCQKWWCEPTNDNYIKAKKYIESDYLMPLQQTIKEEESFLFNLLSQAKIINLDGLLEIDKDDENIIMKTRLSLKTNVDKFIHIKKALIDTFNIDTNIDLNGGNSKWQDLKMNLTKMKSKK